MKRSFFQKFLSHALFVCFHVFMLGLVLPWAFSEPNTMTVLLGGVGGFIAWMYGAIKHYGYIKKDFRALNLLVVLLAGASLFGCSKVPAGNVGVKVYLLGGDKGVESEELGVGRYWIGWNEELYLFPTFTQNYVWTQDKTEGSEEDESIRFQSQSGLSIGADVGISYHIQPVDVHKVFQKYRRGIEEITDVFLRNMVRDAFVAEASTRDVEDIYGEGKQVFLESVEHRVRSQVDSIGISVERIYLVGDLRLPPQVTAALEQKLVANQRASQRENEIREAKAEAQKKIEEARGYAESTLLKAEAEAKALRLRRQELNALIVQYEGIQRWDGKLPQFTGGGSVPMIQIPQR